MSLQMIENFDDIVVRDVSHRHQSQTASNKNIITHTYHHVSGSTTDLSAAEIVSVDAQNQGQWDLLLSSSSNRLDSNSITTANASSLSSKAIVSVHPSKTIFRSSNVTCDGNLTVTKTCTAAEGVFGACILNGTVTGTGVTSSVTNNSSKLITSGGVFSAIQDMGGGSGGGGLSPDPDQPNIRSVGTLTSLNVGGSLVVNSGTFTVDAPTNTVRLGRSSGAGDWVKSSILVDRTWRSVAFGEGVFAAVGSGGSGNRAMISVDGAVTWTFQPTPRDNPWSSIAYGQGVFVAVSSSGSNRCMRSINRGKTWMETESFPKEWVSIAFGNNTFVAVGHSGIKRSTNKGESWTEINPPANQNWSSVTFGNGVFVAVSTNGVGAGVGKNVMTSSDEGLTWQLRSTPSVTNEWCGVTYGSNPGMFVAVARTGAQNRVMISTNNGATWSIRQSAAQNSWTSVTYGNGLFVAVSNTGSNNRVMTSTNGSTWISEKSSSETSWNCVTFGDNRFVAVAETGISNRAMWKDSPIHTDLEVVQDVAVGGDIHVANSLTSNVLRVGAVSGRHIEMSNVAIQFSSSSKVDASITATGALSNGSNGTAELVVTAKDYTYEGSMFNDGSRLSTGVVRVESYIQYPPLPTGQQSIRTYGMSQRFWSGKVPKNSGNYLLQCYGNGIYGLYGTYTVQFMTKSGTLNNAIAMCMRGSAGVPGNSNIITWTILSSTTTNTNGLSIAFGATVNHRWCPQIIFTNTTSVNAWFQVNAVVFDESDVHNEAAT